MKTLIYETLISLANQEPEQHARIRQNLYEQLDLPFDKQLALYSCALVLQVQASWRVVKALTTR
ncbi:PAS factor [Vibrio sp. JCM 18905]|nr:PAS factor [Vibrio sp. JCM 18905]